MSIFLDILPWPPGSASRNPAAEPSVFFTAQQPRARHFSFLILRPTALGFSPFLANSLAYNSHEHSIPNLSATLNVKDFVEVDVNGDGACSYGFVVFIDSKSITIWIGYTPKNVSLLFKLAIILQLSRKFTFSQQEHDGT